MVAVIKLILLALFLLCYSTLVTGWEDTDETKDTGRGLVFWNGGTIKEVPLKLSHDLGKASNIRWIGIAKNYYTFSQKRQKFIVGWSIPLPIHLPFVTLFIHTLQMAYPTISNATQISELLQQGLAKGVRFTKRSVYYIIDRFFSRFGSLNRQCLVRLLCEFSQMSIGHTLAGELLQYILRPEDGAKYSKAWERGSNNEDCNEYYYCPYANDLLSHFTTVQYL